MTMTDSNVHKTTLNSFCSELAFCPLDYTFLAFILLRTQQLFRHERPFKFGGFKWSLGLTKYNYECQCLNCSDHLPTNDDLFPGRRGREGGTSAKNRILSITSPKPPRSQTQN